MDRNIQPAFGANASPLRRTDNIMIITGTFTISHPVITALHTGNWLLSKS